MIVFRIIMALCYLIHDVVYTIWYSLTHMGQMKKNKISNKKHLQKYGDDKGLDIDAYAPSSKPFYND